MSRVLRRRLVLPRGEVAELCARLGLPLPPGFEHRRAPIRTGGLLVDGQVHRSVAAGLAATCVPGVALLVRSTTYDVCGVFGLRGDLGGSLLRAGDSEVEVAAWPAERLGAELDRALPGGLGALTATVVAPPVVIGQVGCPAEGVGAAVAPLFAAALR